MFRELLNKISINPLINSAITSIAIFFCLYFLITKYYGGYDTEVMKNILINSHSIVLDIVIFGVFIYYLNNLGEKRYKIRAYQDEIDDFKNWQSDEALYRILGNIKRLNKFGITNINLSKAVLNNYCFDNFNLQGSFFNQTVMSNCSFNETSLQTTNFSNSILNNTNFSNSIILDSDFTNADFTGANLTNADLSGCILLGAKNLKPEQLIKTKSLFGAKIDEILKEATIKLEASEMSDNIFTRRIFYWRQPHNSTKVKSHLENQ